MYTVMSMKYHHTTQYILKKIIILNNIYHNNVKTRDAFSESPRGRGQSLLMAVVCSCHNAPLMASNLFADG